jgi:hypothetical protein
MVNQEFKHLKKDEIAIVKRFKQTVFLPGEYVYDIHLDVPVPEVPMWWTKKDRANWEDLVAKRIDLTIKQPDKHWIIEVTPKLNRTAIGGVLSYRDLYKKQFKPGVPVAVGIVCEVDDLAYHATLKNNNIKLWVV